MKKKTDEKLSQLAGSINLEAADSEETNRGSSQSKKPAKMKAKAARA
jgi:hypothetical protein